MRTNYLTNFVGRLDKIYQSRKGMHKALNLKSNEEFFKSDGYKEKLLEMRTKLFKTKIINFTDLLILSKDIAQDKELEHYMSLERILNFVSNFENNKDKLEELMKSSDKFFKNISKADTFTSLNIKVKIRRSNVGDRINLNTLIEDLRHLNVDDRIWERVPYWKINMEIPIKHIRVTSVSGLITNSEENPGFDFQLPYFGIAHLQMTVKPWNLIPFLFDNIDKLDYYTKNLNEFWSNVCKRDNEQIRFSSNCKINIKDELDTEFRRFNTGTSGYYVHPYMATSNRQYCLGDFENDFNNVFNNFDFESIALLASQWLSSYIYGHTNPMQQIERFMLGGLDENIGGGIENFDLSDEWQLTCWDRIVTNSGDIKHCNESNCVFRPNCDSYQANIPQETDIGPTETNDLSKTENVINSRTDTMAQNIDFFVGLNALAHLVGRLCGDGSESVKSLFIGCIKHFNEYYSMIEFFQSRYQENLISNYEIDRPAMFNDLRNNYADLKAYYVDLNDNSTADIQAMINNDKQITTINEEDL